MSQLFEKVFNYQLMDRLNETGAYTLTKHERSWLSAMLQRPEADAAFAPGTLAKLRRLLEDEQPVQLADSLEEKAKSGWHHAYHPLLRRLRRIIMARSGVRLTYVTKRGVRHERRKGYPYKLEYSMVKREWYLLWSPLEKPRNPWLMSTKLAMIEEAAAEEVSPDLADALEARLEREFENRARTTAIDVLPAYHQELSRILHAFSCFEKEVTYDEETGQYRIEVSYQGDESHFLLTKIRFLGKRVKIADNGYLQHRMRETAAKALARYGATAMQPPTDA